MSHLAPAAVSASTGRPATGSGGGSVIAVDGPSGSGKSTVARRVAAQLGWCYVDSGATYRAATLAVLRAGVDPADRAAVVAVVRRARIDLDTDPANPAVQLDGLDVSRDVRSPEVTGAVSAVSAVVEVRTQLVELQRRLAGSGGAVVEGRDIGTVVAPTAVLKIFLDASADVRAQRRAAQVDAGVQSGEPGQRVSRVQADLARRDTLDSNRAVSPLTAAPDAVRIDATGLSIEQVTDRVLELAALVGLRAAP